MIQTLFATAVLALAGDRITGKSFATRSEVIARHGMAATSIPLASVAAIDTLKAGNNLIVFPEGTRTVQGRPTRFHRGFADDCLVRQAHAIGGKHAGERMDEHGFHAQFISNQTGMLPARAAEAL